MSIAATRLVKAGLRRTLDNLVPSPNRGRCSRLVVSLTTTPERIARIRPVLDSIMRQQYEPDLVLLHVPYVLRRDGRRYQLPDWLEEYPKVLVHRTEDRGPATKLLGALELERDPDTLIVTLDDDVAYPDFVVRHLLARAERDPNAAHTVVGGRLARDEDGDIDADSEFGLEIARRDGAEVEILAGFGGVIYRRRFFADDIYDIAGYSLPCFLGDDLNLSYYLHRRSIPIRVVRNGLLRRPWSWALGYAEDEGSLRAGAGGVGEGSRARDLRACLRELRTRFGGGYL